jgi:hypothetical protein
MDLECTLVPAKLAAALAEVVEAARHEGREPAAGLVLALVELHRQIDIADLERAARIGAEDPDLTHAGQIPTPSTRKTPICATCSQSYRSTPGSTSRGFRQSATARTPRGSLAGAERPDSSGPSRTAATKSQIRVMCAAVRLATLAARRH